MNKFAVYLTDSRNDTVPDELYAGTLDACHIYAQGWYDALIQHTSYCKISDESDGNLIFFHSPLVSEEDLILWIAEVPTEVQSYNPDAYPNDLEDLYPRSVQ